MNTSYFASNLWRNRNAVAISRGVPPWFNGRTYEPLAPYRWMIDMAGEPEKYTQVYTEQILSKLDPRKTLDELGEDAVLLCWEGPEMFCHRHLVADWLMNALKIEVTELRRLGNGQETMF